MKKFLWLQPFIVFVFSSISAAQSDTPSIVLEEVQVPELKPVFKPLSQGVRDILATPRLHVIQGTESREHVYAIQLGPVEIRGSGEIVRFDKDGHISARWPFPEGMMVEEVLVASDKRLVVFAKNGPESGWQNLKVVLGPALNVLTQSTIQADSDIELLASPERGFSGPLPHLLKIRNQRSKEVVVRKFNPITLSLEEYSSDILLSLKPVFLRNGFLAFISRDDKTKTLKWVLKNSVGEVVLESPEFPEFFVNSSGERQEICETKNPAFSLDDGRIVLPFCTTAQNRYSDGPFPVGKLFLYSKDLKIEQTSTGMVGHDYYRPTAFGWGSHIVRGSSNVYQFFDPTLYEVNPDISWTDGESVQAVATMASVSLSQHATIFGEPVVYFIDRSNSDEFVLSTLKLVETGRVLKRYRRK